MSMSTFTRRAFIRAMGRSAVTVGGMAAAPRLLHGATLSSHHGHNAATTVPTEHPDPRPDADGSAVLSRDEVPAHVADLFDQVREIPHIADGIRCTCGCAEMPGMYSLLSCYEGAGMAQYCTICQGEGRLAHRLHTEGKSLDEIRAVIDRRFG